MSVVVRHRQAKEICSEELKERRDIEYMLSLDNSKRDTEWSITKLIKSMNNTPFKANLAECDTFELPPVIDQGSRWRNRRMRGTHSCGRDAWSKGCQRGLALRAYRLVINRGITINMYIITHLRSVLECYIWGRKTARQRQKRVLSTI